MWFPDNIPRRERALQLANDISVMQFDVKKAKEDMDKADARMVPYLNQLLVNHNMKSFDELKAKVDASLTPEQKAAYEALVKSNEDFTEGTDTAFNATSAMALISGIVGKAIDIGLLLRAGHLLVVTRAYGRAIIKIFTEGVKAGTKAFKLAQKIGDLAIDSIKDISKIAKYASSASKFMKVIAIFGIFADIFILTFDAFAQAKQRDELQDAIKQLFVSRLCCTLFKRMCDVIKTQDGLMLSYLLFVGDDGTITEDDLFAANKIADKLIKNVQEDYESITLQTSLANNIELDNDRKAWTNEDPDHQWAIEEASKDTDDEKSGKAEKIATYAMEEDEPHFKKRKYFERERTIPAPDALVLQTIVHDTFLSKKRLRAILGPVVLTDL